MNLLPKTEKENLKKGFRLRLAVVALIMVSASFLAGLVLLLPSYLLAKGYFSAATAAEGLTIPEKTVLDENFLKLPAEIDQKIKFIQSNSNAVSVIESFDNIITHMPEGVALDTVSFSRNHVYNEKNGTLIMISGISRDRESLTNFSSLLRESGKFSSVDVPVSSLTKDRNLPFSVNIFIEN